MVLSYFSGPMPITAAADLWKFERYDAALD